ncbi:MAG: TIGR04282 family arsenosugar biosynthesis glycosyltransferase [Sphingomicrobium sp.]
MLRPTARILIFAKAPVAGAVKTRLIPRLGAEGAAQLAQEMLHFTCSEALAVHGAQVELCAAPAPDDPQWFGKIPPGVRLSAQRSGDLGDRLAEASQRVIGAGEFPVLVGSDCPGLERNRLTAAIAALDRVDAFLNPTVDGGYALLALRRFSAELFHGVAWSTNSVAEQTLQRIRRLGWSCEVGDTLCDIDEPADYNAWREG